ncbi:MetQ/NlpA family ABC transporter substrate-binding protein [Propioniferax innocua]|uniref:Lipoprotein n=1 Tax=Propioniferax innocua TaxID=1753 RepID=A0A542Z887_9ACTN|nr:MetQ/NlpA family ABC transporter substrate-binding protein [Propioniferax innocua]TQL56552.1 D-methionine transport system substrate-binding protein [Propioniferax innocua]
MTAFGTTLRRTSTTIAIGLTAALALTGCGAGGNDPADPDAPLVVGASPEPHGTILNFVEDELAEEAGLELEVEEFTDYVTPNQALDEGSLDANFFQHEPYLDEYNASHGTDLVAVSGVTVGPMAVYSNKLDDLGALPDGATIAVPNDPTNEARALRVIADAGLITLPEDGQTPDDITENPKNLQFEELEAAQVPRSLDDVDAAVINDNYALEADFTKEDQLSVEKVEGNPYANVLVTRQENKDDPRVQKLLELLQAPETQKFIEDEYNGLILPAE